MTPADFDKEIARIATVPILLVATDYDGTISPIVEDPAQARPHREAIVALNMLAQLPQTNVAVISGRALRDLAELTNLPKDVHLVGSHGSEFDLDFATSLSPKESRMRKRIQKELSQIAQRHSGFIVETKPASVAFHYRNAPEKEAEQAVKDVLDGPASHEGVHLKRGKKVIELGVVATNKATALEQIRHRVGASAVIFFGDDLTDEDAFATLRGPDIAVKIGSGETIARHRINGPEDAAKVLARLAELRADWLAGAAGIPIEKHSMLSDQRTVALLGPRGRIVWLCVPRIDSPSLFAELLGGPTAGYFSIAPADGSNPNDQRYLKNTLILKSRWRNMTMTDFLDTSGGRTGQRAGRSDLVRIIEGSGRIVIEFAPRLDFGRMATRLTKREGGLEIDDTHDPIVLRAPGVNWTFVEEGKHQTARAEFDLTDEPLVLELRYGTRSIRNGSSEVNERLRLTKRFWSSWADQLVIPSIESDLVRHSAVVLRGLVYGPSGAICAAATTSLPEHVGGVRNWDYRYCWLRDAAMSAAALVRLGSTQEAMRFLDWVLNVLDHCDSPERLHPLYSVTGAELGPEAEITELSGYRGSRPVRVGNTAAQQVQLDVFGPIVDLVALLVERDAPLSSEHWRLVQQMVLAVESRWQEPDHGIWEVRRPRRHYVHSKVMCWLTVDRAIAVAKRFLERDRNDWMRLRDRIAKDVLRHGFKKEANAFTAAYDDTDLDAASLHVGLSGLLPVDDPRFLGTLEAVERELREGPTVYRYRADDGLPGFEGGFHICACWLVEAYLRVGRIDDARELFDGITALAGPTGMLSEQYLPKRNRALGNTPQAYSHLGVIENAIHLSQM